MSLDLFDDVNVTQINKLPLFSSGGASVTTITRLSRCDDQGHSVPFRPWHVIFPAPPPTSRSGRRTPALSVMLQSVVTRLDGPEGGVGGGGDEVLVSFNGAGVIVRADRIKDKPN